MTKKQIVLSPILISGVHSTWSAIGDDAMAMDAEFGDKTTNSGAVEMCLDADRMQQYSPKAHAELKVLLEEHGWQKVSQAICRQVKLA